MSPESPLVTVERRGHVLLMGLNRPDKGNSVTTGMLRELVAAYTELENDDDLWVGLVFGHGGHLTTGLDLVEITPHLGELESYYPDGSVDPWGIRGRVRTKPVVAAAQGWVITAGIELLLASDVRIAAKSTRFTQMEVQRGIFAFGGATIRMPREAGWGNAMRWILTGDEFDAQEAYRIGLVQEIVPDGEQFDRALALAEHIAAQAPLAVRASMASARTALVEGENAAKAQLLPTLYGLAGSNDAAEGVTSFIERRPARFTGS